MTRNSAIVAEYEKRAKKLRLGASANVIKAIWNGFGDSRNLHIEYRWKKDEYKDAFHESYRALCGYSPNECATIDAFFCHKFISALQSFFGKDETARIRKECEMAMEYPYSHSLYRPSYRSSRVLEYADTLFMAMVNALDFICLGASLEHVLAAKEEPYSYTTWEPYQYLMSRKPSGLDIRIAYELRNGNGKIFALIEESILGDNGAVQISHEIISGIVKSGDKQAVELLGKLLLAAKGQEGLRQAILEQCDSGTIASHIYFIRLILDNGLCRFSSVVRAFDTWSGLGFGDQKQKVAEKCMALAQKYLEDGGGGAIGSSGGHTISAAIGAGLGSNDTTEIYLALWALCCHDIYGANEQACRLLGSNEKYKRLVGWYFILHTNGEAYRHNFAVGRLAVRDPEELAWICANLYVNSKACSCGYQWAKDSEASTVSKTFANEIYPADRSERLALFGELASVAKFIGKKKTTFAESVFPWYAQELNASAPCGVMLGLAAYDRSYDLMRQIAEFIPLMDVGQRLSYFGVLLNPETPEQRALLLEGLSDKSQTVRERVVNRLQYYALNNADIERLVQSLVTQNADFRKAIMTLLEKQAESVAIPVIGVLLGSHNKNLLMAGVELLELSIKKNPDLQSQYGGKVSALAANESISQDVSILLDKVSPGGNETEGYNEDNGFGLYDPRSDAFDMAVRAASRPPVPAVGDKALKKMVIPDEKDLMALYGRIADVFCKYRDYEYEAENPNGTREKVLLNNENNWVPILAGRESSRNGFGNPITDYPLADEWLEAAGGFAVDKAKAAAALGLFDKDYRYHTRIAKKWFRDLFAGYPIYGDAAMDTNKLVEHIEKKGVKHGKANLILGAILNTGDRSLFDFAFSTYVNIVRKIPEGQLATEFEENARNESNKWYSSGNEKNGGALSAPFLSYWRRLSYGNITNDAQFAAYFNEMWYEFLAAGQQEFYGLQDEDVFRAHSLGLIPDDAVYVYFTIGADAPNHMRMATSPRGRELLKKYPAAKTIVDKTIDRIVSIEENRGELAAPLSAVASSICHFGGGARHFVKLLAALGDMGFHRGYQSYYSYMLQQALTKKEGLSQLLKCCQPSPEDTSALLREALKKAKIPEKRVIQAAVYAPQWAGLLESAMGIAGLKCGVWFFHAHINENFSAEKETEVAIYSAISPQQFNDGTFDKDWFHEAHALLGEKRFNELYKNAKYITSSNSSHRRSQLYADAVLGRLGKNETIAEIIQKRNQEKLRAFALIPLDAQNQNDALERYGHIQQFKKESRQFGSARQASEGKACDIAMDNLAITAGYGDADRMAWALEGAKMEQVRPLMEPRAIDGYEAWLGIEEDGTPEVNVKKAGKPLKAPPKELAKDPYISEIKEAVKQLRDQKRRARASFEMAMVSRAAFSAAEATGLLGHPVLRGMASALLFASGECIGFPALADGQPVLVDADGNSHSVKEDAALIIAHPCDLIAKKCWGAYQQHLYRNKVVQPFKQVFREYYPVTEDELGAVNLSRRYAGNQVQPKKTAALLKTRGWTVDYELGLQRVWHKENLIAKIYALADWFSPADIEAPTLETIQFFRRDKHELVPFADIPAVIFSETMRDVDLAVSVAHAGGVDPEASHSTVEMRIAIARELLSMLSVDNVSFQTAHAQINGSLGEYSVHMGSGVTHKSGTGMIAVLPVHSQARGRIFLPFADDDPKTAEIMSKILLFADDKKIKDPSILGQING